MQKNHQQSQMKKNNNDAHQQLYQVQTKFAVFTTTCCIYYCCMDSRLIFFPVENGGSSWNFRELAIGESGQLEVKDEKENMPFVDVVAIVAEVYGVVCQLYSRLWGTRLWRHKSSVVTKHTYIYILPGTIHDRQCRKTLYWFFLINNMSSCGGRRNEWEFRLTKYTVRPANQGKL